MGVELEHVNPSTADLTIDSSACQVFSALPGGHHTEAGAQG